MFEVFQVVLGVSPVLEFPSPVYLLVASQGSLLSSILLLAREVWFQILRYVGSSAGVIILLTLGL